MYERLLVFVNVEVVDGVVVIVVVVVRSPSRSWSWEALAGPIQAIPGFLSRAELASSVFGQPCRAAES